MGLDLRLRLFSLVEKLPENRLTAPLKKKVDTVLEAEVAAMKQDMKISKRGVRRLSWTINRLLKCCDRKIDILAVFCFWSKNISEA